MPLIEAQPDAVCAVYARSLFDHLVAKGGGGSSGDGGRAAVENALGELEEIVEMARADARFGEFIASRIVAKDDRAKALQNIFRGRCSDPVLNTLLALNTRGRLGALTGFVAAFDQLVQNGFGRVEVDVYTATPMDDADKATLKAKLQSALGREPIIHAYVDESMIGGVRVQVGDMLIDGSVATALRKVREQILTRGSAVVRSSAERIFEAGLGNGTVR
jgi:F-type H+-transporting ATPase subunit delta